MSARAFAVATLTGMIPMTVVYTGLGAIITTGRFPLAITGMMCVILILLFPRAIERYNPFVIRRFFLHLRQQSESDDDQKSGIRGKK